MEVDFSKNTQRSQCVPCIVTDTIGDDYTVQLRNADGSLGRCKPVKRVAVVFSSQSIAQREDVLWIARSEREEYVRMIRTERLMGRAARC